MQAQLERANAAELYGDLENWMKNLPPKLKTVPVHLLAIPGSHDSMTSSITTHSQLAPDAEEFLQRLQWLGPLLRYVMSRWSKTQKSNLLEQLRMGVRYFDLRVAIKKHSGFPYFVHGLYASEVSVMLTELKQFLDLHPMEVVLLDFQHFYDFQTGNHADLINLIKTTFGGLLTPCTTHMDHLTLEYMTSKCRYQIIVIYRAQFSRFKEPLLWPSSNFPTPWPQTVSKTELIEKLTEGISSRSFTSGYVSQCVLTPTSWFVTKHLLSTLKKKCATPAHKVIIEWLNKQKVGIGGVNIVISDFVNLKEHQFTKEVIGLNAKFLHNSLLSAANLTPIDNN